MAAVNSAAICRGGEVKSLGKYRSAVNKHYVAVAAFQRVFVGFVNSPAARGGVALGV